jgi:hypothetical protein
MTDGTSNARCGPLLHVLLICIGFAGGYGLSNWLPSLRSAGMEADLARVSPGDEGGPQGRWNKVALPAPSGASEEEELVALGYLSGSRPAPAAASVTVYSADEAYNGLNLVLSAHEPSAELMTMDGRTIHSWQGSFREAVPDLDTKGRRGDQYWRRVLLLPDGDLLAIYEGLGIVRLTRDSELVWAVANGAHHDLQLAEDGQLYVLGQGVRKALREGSYQEIVADFVSVMDLDGHELRRIPLIEAFQDSIHSAVLATMPASNEYFHTNTLEILDGRLAARSPAFRKGNILLSFLSTDGIGVLDVESSQIVWYMAGKWIWQHQPTVLGNGNMLILDNRGEPGRSKVIEFDPFTQEVAWVYEGTAEKPFFTMTCGSNQRLPNGNTLITESDPGRAFEVKPDGTIVWEYLNPHRAGEENELIATLFEVIRLPADWAPTWLEAPQAVPAA